MNDNKAVGPAEAANGLIDSLPSASTLNGPEPSGNIRKKENPPYVQPPQTEDGDILGPNRPRLDLRQMGPQQSEPAPTRLESGSKDLGGLPTGAAKSPSPTSAGKTLSSSLEAILDAALAADAALGQDAEQTEEQQQEEISGYIDLKRLDTVLAENMPKLCTFYFPKGEKRGNCWIMADPSGAPGESLKIELSGPRVGDWIWVNPAVPPEEKNKRGKFVQLLMLSRNWTFGQAVTNIARIVAVRLIQPWQEYVLAQGVFYESAAAHYWIPHPKGGWIKVVEAGAKRFLQDKGISTKKPKNGLMSPMDRALLALNQNMNVTYAGPLGCFRLRPD